LALFGFPPKADSFRISSIGCVVFFNVSRITNPDIPLLAGRNRNR